MAHETPGRRGRDVGGRDRESDGNVEGLSRSAMCATVGSHIAHVQVQLNALGELSPESREVRDKARRHLDAAKKEIKKRPWHEGLWRRITKDDVLAAQANVNEAEVELTKLLKGRELKNRVPQILSKAREHLSLGDPDRHRLEEQWDRIDDGRPHLSSKAKGVAAETLHAANTAEQQDKIRVRSFTRILICTIAMLCTLAVGFGVWASLSHDVANLFCFPSENMVPVRVCPSGRNLADGGDVFLIEFMGMFAAALAGAAALNKMRGNSSPYHVSVLLLLLRLPVGAMSAVLGILLVSGAFFPGLTSLDTGAQIIAWAAAFGILQEAVTRAVDKQGRELLEGLTPPEEVKAQPTVTRGEGSVPTHEHRSPRSGLPGKSS